MKKLNLLYIVVFLLVGNGMLFSQALVDRLYLSTASTGRVYDITTISPTPGTAIALPTPINVPNSSATPANISNLAVGYDAPGGNPSTLVFIHSNNLINSTVYKNDNAITPAITNPVQIGGIGTNNVPSTPTGTSYFGYVFGFASLQKTLYQIYPGPAASLGAITGDTDWTNGSTFGTDTFFDYQNYIYTFVNNAAGTARYLYKISIATRVASKAIPTPITGSAATVTAIHGMAYLNGDVYIATTTAAPAVEIRKISMKDGSSSLYATYTSSSNVNLDLATVPYYIPFIFNCGGATIQPANANAPFTSGVPATKTVRLPISAVYGADSNYDIITSGTNFTTTTTNVAVTSTTTFVDVQIVYNGTPYSGTTTVPVTISLNGSSTTCTFNAIIERDLDNDGIADIVDLDSDNDGILDIFECADTVVNTTFDNSATPTTPFSFSAPAADLGFIFDVYRLDNSFTLNINGTNLSASELQFQSDQTDNIRFIDGATYGGGTVPQVYSMTGTDANPLIRIIIHKNGSVSMYGSKSSGGVLVPLQLYNGNTFNNITWNRTGANSVQVSQINVGATYITGRGRGLKNGFCDSDNDGLSNQFDVDSDGDGCPDAIEGTEAVRFDQVHSMTLPVGNANYAYRGQIKVTYNGTTTGTPAQIISTTPSAAGVPQLVNYAGFNLNATTNASNLAGLVDNTDGTIDIGQGIGTSQNATTKDVECDRCFRPATTPGVGGEATSQGFTALARAGGGTTDWPIKIKGAYTALDAKTKGFVINRVPTASLTSIVGVAGMMVYDTTENCLKIYDGTVWSCFSKQTCNNFNQ